MEDKNNIDDLIGSSSQNIIVDNSNGNDKKFLIIIIILLIILFLLALGVIALISNRSLPKSFYNTAQTINRQQEQNSQAIKQVANTPIKSADNNEDLNELEKIIQSNSEAKPQEVSTQKSNKKLENAISNTTNKKLSQEELAVLAKLVAKELAKEQKNNTQNIKTTTNTKNSDEELLNSLQNAQTDTLKEEKIDTNNLSKDSKAKSNINKKIDTFNKVIVKENINKDDEIAKLSAEIDSILQTKEVEQKEKNLKYAKEFKEDIKNREREMRFIVVKKGDTLSSIAYRAYGRASAYKKIYEANPDLIKNPNKIYVGMKLRVPVDEEYLKRQGN